MDRGAFLNTQVCPPRGGIAVVSNAVKNLKVLYIKMIASRRLSLYGSEASLPSLCLRALKVDSH